MEIDMDIDSDVALSEKIGGSFNRGLGMEIHMDIDSDMAVSKKWGIL